MTALIVFCAKYLFVLAPAITVLVFWKLSPKERRVMAVRGLVVLVLAVALAKGGGAVYHDTRPFAASHVQPLIPHVADNGFPSDHTLLAACCAFLVLPFSLPAAGVTALVAIIVGAARVASLLHWPLDIGASLVFAAIANGIAWLVVRPRPTLVATPSPDRFQEPDRKTS
ncbi:MAG: phosphatase PAP2 family protein [Armatimonadota bacterium]|nr:phosphatase PAP2 family protein [Armatimonadota bacterium]